MALKPMPDVANRTFRKVRAVAAAVSVLALASSANAKLYVFGDSLSDNGNIDKVTFGIEPSDDYFNGRFSNGPVWTELLGYRLGRAPGLLYYDPLFTSRVDGYNFAHGGAAAVERRILPDFLEGPGQASYFAKQVRNGRMSARSGDIATLWIGGNDYLNYDEGSPNAVVNGVMKSLRSIDSTGVGRIVLLNLPALGEIPGEITGPDRYKLNVVSNLHNMLLNTAVKNYRPTARAQIVQVDIPALFAAVRRGAGGFTVLRPGDRGSRTGTCRGDGLVLAACPSNYFFYDGVHPTAAGHGFIAGVVRDRLAAPIAAAARVSLGQASALSAMTAQLSQVRTRVSFGPSGGETDAYAFGSGDAAQDKEWSQGFGADWRSGGWTFGLNMLEARNAAALDESAAMSAKGEAMGYAVYAAWQDEGFTAALAMTALKDTQAFDRQTEIDGLSRASGTGEMAATSLQAAIAHEFRSAGFSIRPEAALTLVRFDFARFSETGTMGLSDNVYEAQSVTGALGEIGATLRYAEEDWGASLRAYTVANMDGDASVWTAAPQGLIAKTTLSPGAEMSEHGAGVWAQLWLTGSDAVRVSAEGGAFTDLRSVEGAARLTLRYEF